MIFHSAFKLAFHSIWHCIRHFYFPFDFFFVAIRLTSHFAHILVFSWTFRLALHLTTYSALPFEFHFLIFLRSLFFIQFGKPSGIILCIPCCFQLCIAFGILWCILLGISKGIRFGTYSVLNDILVAFMRQWNRWPSNGNCMAIESQCEMRC